MHTDVKIFNCIGLTNSIKRMAYECAPLSEYIPLIQVLLLRKVASLFGIRIEYLFRNQLNIYNILSCYLRYFIHIFSHSFRFAQARTSHEKSCPPPLLVLKCYYGIAIHYRAWEEEWRSLFGPVYLYVPSSLQAQTSGTLNPDSYHG